MDDFYDDPAFAEPGFAEPGFDFYRVRTVGDTLSDTFDFVRQHVRELFVGLLVIVGPLLLIQVLATASFQTAWLDTFMASDAFADPDAVFDFYGDFGAQIAVTWITSLLAYALMAAATFGFVQLVQEGEAGAISPGALWEATKPNILPLLGISLLAGLIVVVGAVVNILPCLGTLAWIAGVVYLLPIFWIWQPARVFGGGTVGRAFGRARALVKGQWGPTFGALLLIIVVMVVIAVVAGMPLYGLAFWVGWSGEATGPLARVGMLGSTILGGLIYFVYALAYVGAALHYFNLVERSDAVGLASRVDDLDDFDTPDAPAAW